MAPELFKAFSELTYRHTGIVLADGNEHLVAGRIRGRVRALGLAGAPEYLALLRAGGPELDEFVNAITTNVTAFFREPEHFKLLHRAARKKAAEGRSLRIWCAAASSGEEPYSIAITLREALGDSADRCSVFATDINSEVIEHARTGRYEQRVVANLGDDLMARHFERDGDLVAVVPATRRLVTFSTLNLIEPAWRLPGGFDIVFCRNVMIYFDRPTQAGIVSRLTGQLRPGGLLLVGHSESLAGLCPGLTTLRPSIYQRPLAHRRAS
ncbi:MAG: protein-glutamate O-methyltransferase CheR [Proteobacteria bacterium]|nr:protein-glutamate O-methyltransferase CheR [Pseudomonadota bacterium]MCP4916913.1 protein-glutamate O-methyltransferase CheR [Pseudomonadota bacterium]